MKKTVFVLGALLAMTGLAFAYNKALETAGSRSECLDMTDRISEGCNATCKDLGGRYGGRTEFLCYGQCFDDWLDNFYYCETHFEK